MISDGLPGIENSIKKEFKCIYYQRSVVHLVRNLKSYTNKNNCKEIINDFKNIYSAPNKKLALEYKDYFMNKYKD